MKSLRMLAPAAALWIGIAWIQAAEEKPAGPTPGELLTQGLQQIVGLIEPAPGTEPRVFSTGWEVTRSEGLPKELSKLQGDLAIQAPDHARGRIQAGKQEFRIRCVVRLERLSRRSFPGIASAESGWRGMLPRTTS